MKLTKISRPRTLFRRAAICLSVALFAASLGEIVMAQSKDEIETRNKAAVKAGFDAWSSVAGSPYNLLADDASSSIAGHSTASKTYPSKEAFMSEVIRPTRAVTERGQRS